MKIDKKDILVRVMRTPNPLAVKLVVNFLVKAEGKTSFTTAKEVKNIPLFYHLFGIGEVLQIHVFENQITISHNENLKFEEIQQKAEQVIKNYGANHNPEFTFKDKKLKKKDRSDMSKEQQKAEEVLDRTIRPGLQMDGGDLEIISFKDNKIEIAYQGACGGCPSSYTGTLDAIENILRFELKNDKLEVYPVNPV